MNERLKLEEEKTSILAVLNTLSAKANDSSANITDEDALTFQQKNARLKEIDARLKELDAEEKPRRNEMASFQYDQSSSAAPNAPMAPSAYNQTDDFNNGKKKGYQSAGELAADVIAFSQWGTQSDRLSSYVKSTKSLKVKLDASGNIVQDFQQASGAASTLIDGVEMIPELLPEIKEYGVGSGVNEILEMFAPVNTGRTQVDYFINEDTYNVNGLVVARIKEGGQLSAQNFNNDRKMFRLYKVGIFAQITREDLQNIPLLESRYMRRAPQTINVQKVQDIIAGNGLAMPIGFNTDKNTAAVVVNRTADDDIQYADIRKMLPRVKRGNATGQGCWVTNENSIEALMGLKDDANRLLWRDNTNTGILGDLIPGTLGGYPVIISEDNPLLSERGCLTFQHTAGYIFGQHTEGTRYAESMHFFFDRDSQALRWLSQYGGQPVFQNPYNPRRATAQGSTFKLSHTIRLNANGNPS